jgi:hypothetical protein
MDAGKSRGVLLGTRQARAAYKGRGPQAADYLVDGLGLIRLERGHIGHEPMRSQPVRHEAAQARYRALIDINEARKVLTGAKPVMLPGLFLWVRSQRTQRPPRKVDRLSGWGNEGDYLIREYG